MSVLLELLHRTRQQHDTATMLLLHDIINEPPEIVAGGGVGAQGGVVTEEGEGAAEESDGDGEGFPRGGGQGPNWVIVVAEEVKLQESIINVRAEFIAMKTRDCAIETKVL